MRRSYLPILIASVLLLSAASPTPKPSVVPSPRETTIGSKESKLERQATDEKQANASHAPAIRAPDKETSANSKSDQSKDHSGWRLLFTGVAAVATALIAIFNGQLVRVTRDMVRAAEAAAQAADAALDLDRPAILVTFIEPRVGTHQPSGRANTLISFTPIESCIT